MRSILLLSAFLSTAVHAGDPMCGTGPETDARVRQLHERTRARIAASAAGEPRGTVTLREGAFYVENDETITPGHRPFDLHGRSLVFTPAGNAAFTMRQEALQYVEPQGAPVRDFSDSSYNGWHSVAVDLPFAFPLFGESVTRLYADAYNGIRTANPRIQKGTQFDAIQAGVHRGPLLSPLMVTMNARAPRPQLWVDQQPGAVILTWRGSSATTPFVYDLQAKLASDGTVTYSYRSVVALHWGAPILSPGLDPATVARAAVGSLDDRPADVSQSVPAALRPMLDVQRVEVQRLGDSGLFAVRMILAGAVERTKLASGQSIVYEARLSGIEVSAVRISRSSTEVFSFTDRSWNLDGESAHVDGNVIEIYGVQREAAEKLVRVQTSLVGDGPADVLSMMTAFPAAPRPIVTDLSAAAQDARLEAPIAETFVLGEFDPYRTWDIVRNEYGLSGHEYDAVAMYQSHYTDLILYAGAYATGGNPQVEGVRPFSPWYGRHAAKAPTLLHMNQLTYGYGREERSAAQVLLHEFGHRWLYFFNISENGNVTSSLNPVSPHPAAYVHTESAFPVYGAKESSVMGGAYFTRQPNGSYVAHAANVGFSWTDLYLMGLAAPEEVVPWFYLAGTSLPQAYWPPEGAVVTGQKRDVRVDQITAVHGPRIPSTELSQRQFRVLFVLVTEGGEPTDAEVAKMNQWRSVMERNFALATGGRGKLITTFLRPGKRRAM